MNVGILQLAFAAKLWSMPKVKTIAAQNAGNYAKSGRKNE
jgi:hypothetical protein